MGSRNCGPTPKFTRPPVIETILGVQFKPLLGMRITHFGLFWQRIRDKFPEVLHHMPLDPAIESFGQMPLPEGPRWNIVQNPELPRSWFLGVDSEKGQQLIQLQRDRFLQNWRRASLTAQKYPSYRENRCEFENNLKLFEGFLAEEDLGSLAPTQCEVTYVNHIPLDKGCSVGEMARRCFPGLAGQHSDEFLPPDPEQIADYQASYLIEETSGRLHIRLQPASSVKTGEVLLRLILTARGAPAASDSTALMGWLDLGHYWVVKGFRSFTSRQMHERWGEIIEV